MPGASVGSTNPKGEVLMRAAAIYRPVQVHRVVACVVFIAILGLIHSADARAQEPETTPLEQVQALVQPGIVYESITYSAVIRDVVDCRNCILNKGRPFSLSYQCSGFFINPEGYVATAGHCVEWDDEVRTALISKATIWAARTGFYGRGVKLSQIRSFAYDDYRLKDKQRSVVVAYGVAASGLPTGQALPARVLGLQGFESTDVALLKIEGNDLPALELAPDSDVAVGTEVVSVGYPASVDLVADETFDPSFKDGTISSVKTIGNGLLEVYEISAAVSGGMSGGPTVNRDGQVIGVNSFGIRGEPQAFNFVRPASAVAEFASDKGVDNEVGDVNAAYREGLEAYFAGDRATALQKLDEVLELVPSHELAQAYRADAARLPESESAEATSPTASDDGGTPLGLILGLVLGALVLAGAIAAAVLLQRRRSVAPAGAPGRGSTPTATSSPEPPLPMAATPPATERPRQVTGQRFCPQCGAPNASGAKFCESCGHQLSELSRRSSA